MRSFTCHSCLEEVKGTPQETELNALKVKEVVKIYQSQIDLQSFVDFDQDLQTKSQMAFQTREHILKDRKRVLESVT